MLIPSSWLKEYVDIKLPFPELALKLSEAGLTVEKWEEKDGDIIFDPEVTPNRPDWLSLCGIAREVAALTNTHLKDPNEIALNTKYKTPKTNYEITLKPNYAAIPRMTSVIVQNVKVKPSPDWLQKRIKQIGLRPINNLVDITNFVLWTFGSPLHVFDYDKIRGHQIIVDLAKGGEPFRSLDGLNYTLPKNAIIIKDVGRIIDLPPLKGGENSAISPETKNVLLHSIVCDPVLTRRTSQSLGLRSDSSAISERGVDPNGTVPAVKLALKMILDLAGGEVASELLDHKDHNFKPWTVEMGHNKLESVLGLKFEPKKVVQALVSLQLKPNMTNLTNKSNLIYAVEIPTFRPDLKIEEDLIEEVGRLYGYNHFPKTLPASPVPTAKVAYAKNYDFEYEVKQILQSAGYSEIYTYSLVSETQLIKLGINPGKTLRVDNPISRDYEYLRPALVGNLLDAYKLNQANFPQIKLFELGKEYKGESLDKAKEEYWVWGIESGENFHQAKGFFELLLNNININYHLRPIEPSDHFNWCHPGRTALVFTGDKKYLGFIGEAHPSLLAKWAIKNRAVIWELDYGLLEKLATSEKKYHPIPKYPPVIEDLSLIIPDDILYSDVVSAIKRTSLLVNSIDLLDTHEDSRTLRLTYLDESRNLSDKDAAEIRLKILKTLKEKLGVKAK